MPNWLGLISLLQNFEVIDFGIQAIPRGHSVPADLTDLLRDVQVLAPTSSSPLKVIFHAGHQVCLVCSCHSGLDTGLSICELAGFLEVPTQELSKKEMSILGRFPLGVSVGCRVIEHGEWSMKATGGQDVARQRHAQAEGVSRQRARRTEKEREEGG